MTETITAFGRYFPIYTTLVEGLNSITAIDSPLECLIVGPGAIGYSTEPFASYQPFEIANAIERAGKYDYHITIADINPEIIKMYAAPAKNPTWQKKLLRTKKVKYNSRFLRIGRQFSARQLAHLYPAAGNAEDYMNQFFPEERIPSKIEDELIIDVSRPLSRMEARIWNVATDTLPGQQYQLIVCTAVLGPYFGCEGPFAYDETAGMVERKKAEIKLSESLMPGGFLLIEPLTIQSGDFTLLAELQEGRLHTICLYRKNA